MSKLVQLTGLSQPELVSFVETLGEPAYRGRQLFAALQNRRLRSFDEITDLPKGLRTRLNEIAQAATLKVESQYTSSDGTRRCFDGDARGFIDQRAVQRHYAVNDIDV